MKDAKISLIRPYSSQREIYDKNLKGITYTQSEYRISNYVNHIRIIV
jgi:hypothetical protein